MGWSKAKNRNQIGFKNLLRQHFTALKFSGSVMLAEDDKELLMKNDNILTLYKKNGLSLSNGLASIPLLPPSVRTFKVGSIFLYDFILCKPDPLSFVNIQQLLVKNGFSWDLGENTKSQQFSAYIAEHFPSLQFMHIYNTQLTNLSEHLKNISILNSSAFQGIPSTVKGTIQIEAKQNLNNDILNEERNLASVANSRQLPSLKFTETNDGKIIFTKEFEIHEGLNFKFSATFIV